MPGVADHCVLKNVNKSRRIQGQLPTFISLIAHPKTVTADTCWNFQGFRDRSRSFWAYVLTDAVLITFLPCGVTVGGLELENRGLM
jgi:hypothetical protein